MLVSLHKNEGRGGNWGVAMTDGFLIASTCVGLVSEEEQLKGWCIPFT